MTSSSRVNTAIESEKAGLNSSTRVDRNRVYSNDGPSEIGARHLRPRRHCMPGRH